MTIRSFFVAVILLAGSLNANGKSQDIESMRAKVLSHAQTYYENKYASSFSPADIKITVSQLDKRLKLEQCDNYLTFTVKEPPHGTTNAKMKVSCSKGAQWSIYVPLRIDMFANVLIAGASLNRGEVLDDTNIEFAKINLSTAKRGYVRKLDRALGMELKRPIKAGAIINLSNLKLPNLVLKGQEVVVESNSPLLKVEALATAMTSGSLGQQIRVKNTRSNRIIAATVIASGRVKVGI